MMAFRNRAAQLLRLGAGALVFALFFTGCAKPPERPAEPAANETAAADQTAPATTEEAAADEVSTRKDSLVMAIASEPDEGFDPITGWGRYGNPLFQSTLLRVDKDMHFVNDLAVSYEACDDALTWTFVLRDDALFSDGTPVTAADVAFSFLAARDAGTELDLGFLQDAEPKDDHTVVFHLSKAQSTFLNNAATLGIVPKASYGPGYAENPIGSGPFVLAQWDKGQQAILERNESYYGNKPAFEKLTLLFLAQDAALAAAQTGSVDVVAIAESMAETPVPGMTLVPVHTVDNRGISFPMDPPGGTTPDGLPFGNAVSSDAAIRQAMQVGISRQAIIDDALYGHGRPAYSVCDGMPWWNEASVVQDGDAAQAQAILDAAGWKDADGDGIREKDGVKAEMPLIYPAGDSTRQSVAMSAAQQAKTFGLSLVVEGMGWDDIGKRMYSEPVLFGWGDRSPLEMFNLYYSAGKHVGYNDVNGYENKSVDAHMEAALAATTAEAANAEWKAAQEGVIADIPWIWLVNVDHLYLVRDGLDIGDQPLHPHGHGWPILTNIDEWSWKD